LLLLLLLLLVLLLLLLLLLLSDVFLVLVTAGRRFHQYLQWEGKG
jgi:hypothetical protein